MRFRLASGEALVAAFASAGAVALVTAAIAVARPYVPVLSLGVLYVFAVLPVAVAWGLAAGGVMYGYAQRKLRSRANKKYGKQIRALQVVIDKGRSSSELTELGDTNPEDE